MSTKGTSYIAEVYKVVTPMFDVAMGERLRLLRVARDMDQADLALLMGVSQSIISKFELGRGPTCERPFSVAKLQEVFGKDTLFILLGLNPERFAANHLRHKYWSKRYKKNKGKGRGVVKWAKT